MRQSYVAKMVRRFKHGWLDLANTWPEATLEDLRRAGEVRKRVRARLAEERLWEKYDREQGRLGRGQSGDAHEDAEPPA